MSANKTVSILGCGWLGLPLAEQLIKEGYSINGSTTTEPKISLLERKGIIPFLFSLPLTKKNTPENFFDTDLLFINLPPQSRKHGEDFHKNCIESFLSFVKEKTQLIYISSTSVYQTENKIVDENATLNTEQVRSRAIIAAENLLQEHFPKRLTILRLGGLLGYDRIPGKYFRNKIVEGSNRKVNYIHLDDALAIISQLISAFPVNDIFNVVAPRHPEKENVYKKNASDFDLDIKGYKRNSKFPDYKIASAKIVEYLDYSFKYPDPMDFDYIL